MAVAISRLPHVSVAVGINLIFALPVNYISTVMAERHDFAVFLNQFRAVHLFQKDATLAVNIDFVFG